MSGLQARLDSVFGNLGTGPTSTPPWRPVQEHVFRIGSDLDDEMSSDEDEEYKERTRREVLLGTELANEDAPDEEGLMPSTAFCSQLDREADRDDVDAIAVSAEHARPDPRTEVLDDNVYEHKLALLEDESSPMEEDSGPFSHPLGRHAVASSPSFKSNLRKSPRAGGVKKRVSFTGIPDPPKPWVPPHKRANFISKFESDTMPPTGPAPEALKNLKVLPDHVANPTRYTRYDLEQSLVVGGGVGQLGEAIELETATESEIGNQAVQDALATAQLSSAKGIFDRNGDAEQPIEEVERWQGAVGAGIKSRFSRQEGGSGSHAAQLARAPPQEGGRLVEGPGRDGGGGGRVPIATSFDWEGDGSGEKNDEDYVMDENGGPAEEERSNGGHRGEVGLSSGEAAARQRRQYRKGSHKLENEEENE